MRYLAFDIFICFKVCDKLDIFLESVQRRYQKRNYVGEGKWY